MAVIQIDWNPPRRILRNFGLIGLVAFGAMGSLICWQIGPGKVVPAGAATMTATFLWVTAAHFGVFAAVAPALLRPVYLVLTVVTYPIGFVLSYVVMALIFYGVIVPIGLVFKIVGRDAMCRRFDASARTYWIRRRPPDSVKRYFRQF
jgi:hypothetical protein